MRILLAHNSLYYPSHGGGDKSNRLLMEALAARGHAVRVVARIEKFGAGPHQRFLRGLAARGVTPAIEGGAARFTHRGVDVHTLTLDPQMRAFFACHVDAFDPAVILTSTDDPAQLLFEIAVRAPRARVVHLVRATIAVPFGPDSSMASAARTETLRRADHVVGVSEYVARYVRERGGMDAVHVPISLMEPGDSPCLGRFDSPYITIVNPCAVKGIGIFIALAARMPDLTFAAVPTWGANAADLSALRAQPNVRLLEPADDINDILAQTRVLLVPSVWAEARSRVVLEAMSRGVPVIASDVGGIPEAKLGVPYLVPVRPITSYRHAVDENMVPVAVVPPQDIEPWANALRRLTSDAAHWSEISTASREAALGYTRTLSAEPFERLLLDVVARPRKTAPDLEHPALSPQKQRLLALRLQQKAWFPNADAAGAGKVRLFCFPHAGGGTLSYRDWTAGIPARFAVCPALLPGRESRIGEPSLESMAALIEALTAAIRPYLDQPFAFFGHSMGAGIAFELARSLRRAGLLLPRALYVSSARAPQFRLDYTPGPEPSGDELMADLPDHHDSRQLILPVLRADARLYRRYTYAPELPLDVPIFAYGGAEDPGVRAGHLDAWRGQTTGNFLRREFPGGHFYLHAYKEEFLAALTEDLQAVP